MEVYDGQKEHLISVFWSTVQPDCEDTGLGRGELAHFNPVSLVQLSANLQ